GTTETERRARAACEGELNEGVVIETVVSQFKYTPFKDPDYLTLKRESQRDFGLLTSVRSIVCTK
ncbi:hypothetical protein A2U01_0056986, partial [Trifolium medium]|nr:hypothetical protein [Trifolium medium]